MKQSSLTENHAAHRKSRVYQLTITAVLLLLIAIRWWDPEIVLSSRLRGFDLLQQIGLPQSSNPAETAVVLIDDRSIDALGDWPWPRDQLGRLIETIAASNARAIAVDILLPGKTVAGQSDSRQDQAGSAHASDKALSDALRLSPTILAMGLAVRDGEQPPPSQIGIIGSLPATMVEFAGVRRPLALLRDGAAGEGLFNILPEPDNVPRRFPAILNVSETVQPSLAVETIRVAEGNPALLLEEFAGTVRGLWIGEKFYPTDPTGRLWPDFSDNERIERISAIDLLNGGPRANLRDRPVVIGVAAAGTGDWWRVPTGDLLSGAEAKAVLLEAMISDRLLRAPLGMKLSEILGLACIALTVIALRRWVGGIGIVVALVSSAGAWVLLSIYAFRQWQLLVDPVFAPGALLVIGACGAFLDLWQEGQLRKEGEARAVQAHQRLVDALEAVPDGFVIYDADRERIFANRAYIEMRGGDADAIDPRTDFQHSPTPGAAPADTGSAPDGRLGNTAASRTREELDPAGRWLRIKEQITSEGGLVRLYVDLSDARKRERELLAAKEAASAASEAKSEFLSNVSHELRTPINAIIGFSEIMSAEMFGPIENANYKGYAADIEASGKSLLTIIDGILTIVDTEKEGITLNETDFRLASVLDDVCDRFLEDSSRSGLKILNKGIGCDVRVHADIDQIREAASQVVANAIEFSPSGSAISVDAGFSETAQAAFVSIQDAGPGMTDDEIANATDPFWRFNSSWISKGGIGLGLTLVRDTMERHGGRIEFENADGGGLLVTLFLPNERVLPPASGDDAAS